LASLDYFLTCLFLEGTVCGMTSEFGVLYQSFQYLLMGSSEILFIVTGKYTYLNV